MGKEKNFGEKANTNGLKQNPQNINKKGQPKKMYRYLSDELEAMGYDRMTKGEYEKLMALVFQANEQDLQDMAANIENPYPLRLFLIGLNDKRMRYDMLKDLRDWLYGRASQSVDVTSGGEVLQGTELIVNLVNELNKLDEETGEGESPGQEPV